MAGMGGKQGWWFGCGRMTWGGGAGGEASGTHCPMLTHRQDAWATRTGLDQPRKSAKGAKRPRLPAQEAWELRRKGWGVSGEVRTAGPRATGHAWLHA